MMEHLDKFPFYIMVSILLGGVYCVSDYTPPFHITDEITNLVAAISEQIGRITVLSHGNLNPRLRSNNDGWVDPGKRDLSVRRCRRI